MISVKEIIKKILKKKGWTLTKFAEEINIIREKAGLKGKTTKQNIWNCLNDKKKNIRYTTLVIWEKALKLPEDSLCQMVRQPVGSKAKKNLDEIKKRVRKI